MLSLSKHFSFQNDMHTLRQAQCDPHFFIFRTLWGRLDFTYVRSSQTHQLPELHLDKQDNRYKVPVL